MCITNCINTNNTNLLFSLHISDEWRYDGFIYWCGYFVGGVVRFCQFGAVYFN